MSLSLKRHETLTENRSIKIYVNKIKNRILFETKIGYKLETIKLSGSRKKDDDKDKDGGNFLKLDSVEVILVHCNLVENDYQHTSKALFTFALNKRFFEVINIWPHSLTMMNTVNTEFSFAEVWFTNKTTNSLEIEDDANLTLINA